MIKTFSNILYYFLEAIDRLLFLLFKKSFLIYFNEKLNLYLYIKKKISNKNIIFFTPNHIIRWRTNTLETQEAETIEWIKSFNKNTSENIIFWDIGANIGLYSIYAASIFENVKVISFEPSTSNLRVLSRNISINKFEKKIFIFQIPLYDNENVFLQMNESKFIEGWSMHSFGTTKNFEGKTFIPENKYTIFGTSINDILRNKILEIPNFIKIDVDGLEHLILNGASNYLSNPKIKSLLVEVNENYDEQYSEILNIMKKNNFKITNKINSGDIRQEFSKTFNYIFEKNGN